MGYDDNGEYHAPCWGEILTGCILLAGLLVCAFWLDGH